jgi:hypothetical protein
MPVVVIATHMGWYSPKTAPWCSHSNGGAIPYPLVDKETKDLLLPSEFLEIAEGESIIMKSESLTVLNVIVSLADHFLPPLLSLVFYPR